MSRTVCRRMLPSLGAVVVAWALAAIGRADDAVTVFTYQGSLNAAGAPAAGPHDMRFRLYDDPAAGTQIGPMLTFDGVGANPPPLIVEGGLFSAALDFGPVFTGKPLWLEIDVRPNGVGSYTTLAPRQPITAAPLALYALAGPGGEALWQQNGSGIFYDQGNVGIGTDSPATTLEVLGPIRSQRADDPDQNIQMHSTTSSGHWLRSLQRESNKKTLFIQNSHDGSGSPAGATHMLFRVGATAAPTEAMRIQENGRIGVGTSSLDTYGTFVVRQQSDDIDGGLAVRSTGARSLRLWIGPDDDICHIDSGQGTSPLVLNGAGGNVGIGTGAPTARLHVENDSLSETTLRVFNDNGPGALIQGSNGDSLTVVGFSGTTLKLNNFGSSTDTGVQIEMNGGGTPLVARKATAAGDLAVFNVGTAQSPVVKARIDHDGKGVFEGGIEFGDGSVQTSAAQILSASVVVNPPGLSAGSSTVVSVAVPGAAVGDAVVVNPGANLPLSYAISYARVSAAGTVVVGMINPGTVAADPASTTWQFRIIK